MKKFLLTLILAISFFGTSFADGVDGAYESYWGPIEDIMYNYDYNICVTGFLYVDDVMVELDADDDWRAWELAFFADAECTDLRGHDFLDYPENGGDFVHPALNALTMYVNASACATTQFFVKVYNHKTQMFYDAVLNREVWGQHEDWIELSDRRIVNEIDGFDTNSDADWGILDDIVKSHIDAFEDEYDVELKIYGINGRHVCCAINFYNTHNYEKLVDAINKYQNAIIEEAIDTIEANK